MITKAGEKKKKKRQEQKNSSFNKVLIFGVGVKERR